MRKAISVFLIILMAVMLPAGCGGRPADKAGGHSEDAQRALDGAAESASEMESDAESASEAASGAEDAKAPEAPVTADATLAQRIAGKYSFHCGSEDGRDEYLILEVLPFGDNLYAFCGQAAAEDSERLQAYSFWAAEFLPFDASELADPKGSTATVCLLRFSVMSNAGRYWDGGHIGTITLEENGLVFEGFDHDGFLVPEDGGSRLFLKDDRVEDTFPYLRSAKNGDAAFDGNLDGLWVFDREDTNVWLAFDGPDMYVYGKDPGTEVFLAGGSYTCEDVEYSCLASRLGYGGMPLELHGTYTVSGGDLIITMHSEDLPEIIPEYAVYKRAADGNVHVTSLEEAAAATGAVGPNGEYSGIHVDQGADSADPTGKESDPFSEIDLEQLRGQEYYGVFVLASRTPEGCRQMLGDLEKAGFPQCFMVFTPDFSGLNPEPYYCVTAGLFASKDDAAAVLSEVKAAGFTEAYVKQAGSFIGDRYWYTMYSGGQIDAGPDAARIRGVYVSIPYPAAGETVMADLLVTKDTVFDPSADMQFFGNVEDGDTPYEWMERNLRLLKDDPDRYQAEGPALNGVFEVGLDGNRITRYYGSCWWD